MDKAKKTKSILWAVVAIMIAEISAAIYLLEGARKTIPGAVANHAQGKLSSEALQSLMLDGVNLFYVLLGAQVAFAAIAFVIGFGVAGLLKSKVRAVNSVPPPAMP